MGQSNATAVVTNCNAIYQAKSKMGTMKLASGLVAVCLLAAAKASPGGYTLKGGVIDFKRPLDYERAAVQAGKFAWSQKYSQELEEQGAAFGVRSEKRQAPAYIPTFFTSQANHAALTQAAQQQPSYVRTQREAFQKPLYYESYHKRK